MHTQDLQGAAFVQEEHVEESCRELRTKKEQILKHVEQNFNDKIQELQNCNENLNLKKKAAETERLNSKIQNDVTTLKSLMEDDPERANRKLMEIRAELEEIVENLGAYETAMFTIQTVDLMKVNLVHQELSTQQHKLCLNLSTTKNVRNFNFYAEINS